MNRDRIRFYKCREFDHFPNECPNTVTDDSGGYESDRVALQLITAEAEIHDNFNSHKTKWGTRLFKFIKVNNATTSFLPQTKKGAWVRFDNKIRDITDTEGECLTEDQARHIYNMVEMDKIIYRPWNKR